MQPGYLGHPLYSVLCRADGFLRLFLSYHGDRGNHLGLLSEPGGDDLLGPDQLLDGSEDLLAYVLVLGQEGGRVNAALAETLVAE